MLSAFQVVTLLIVSLAMVPALAHALELPGKRRLPKESYLAVQPIYYPGFTIAGGFEFLGMAATAVLLFLIPRDEPAFWLTLWALIALLVMHAVFWIFTQPVNQFWLRETEPRGAGKAFFRIRRGKDDPDTADWRALRDRWEYSHVARAAMAVIALCLLASALATM